jgi:hypothetical protein
VGAERVDLVVDAGDEDWRLVGNKTSATRLGFSVLLKFFPVDRTTGRHADALRVLAAR